MQFILSKKDPENYAKLFSIDIAAPLKRDSN